MLRNATFAVFVFLALATACLFPDRAHARTRALVVANSYSSQEIRLANSARNLSTVTLAFEAAFGLENVTPKSDVSLSRLLGAIEDFTEDVQPGDTVVFYFSGHGLSFKGDNYIIANNARAGNNANVRDFIGRYGLQLSRIRTLLSGKAARIVLLIDACRTSNIPTKGVGEREPQESALDRILDLRNGSSFATLSALTAANTYIGFASQPGTLAFDDFRDASGNDAGRSPFAAALEDAVVRHAKTDDFDLVFRLVRLFVAESMERSGKTQVPWSQHNLIEPLFVGCSPSRRSCGRQAVLNLGSAKLGSARVISGSIPTNKRMADFGLHQLTWSIPWPEANRVTLGNLLNPLPFAPRHPR